MLRRLEERKDLKLQKAEAKMAKQEAKERKARADSGILASSSSSSKKDRKRRKDDEEEEMEKTTASTSNIGLMETSGYAKKGATREWDMGKSN